MQHATGNPVRAAEQTFSEDKIGSRQGVTHLGTADADAIELDGLRRFNSETLHDAGLLQEIEIPYPVTAETEVVTDFKVLNTEAVHHNGIDEFAGAEFAQAMVKRQAQDPVDAFASQQLQLVTQAGQTGRCGVRSEKLSRLRLENHHAAGHAQLERTLTQPRQDSLVATVNTVKVANSGDTAPMLGAQIVEASNQLHNALLAHKVVDYNHTRRPTTGNTVSQSNRADRNAGPTRFFKIDIEVLSSAQRLAIEVAQTEAHQH
jgi:hypothetical protein